MWNYVATGGIEERIARLVGDKQALFSGLFDGTSDEVAFDSSGSFLSRVREIVREEQDEQDEQDEDRDAHVLEAVEPAEVVADADVLDVVSPPPPAVTPFDPDEHTHRRAATIPATVGLEELLRAFAGIETRAVEGGRVAFELPAPAASALGGLLRSLARVIDGSANAAIGAEARP
ncbi:MAG TPA: hypothetical protein VGM90_27165 [Kofleriaceae bacterium]